MRHKLTILLTVAVGVASATMMLAATAKDAGRGRAAFEKRCGGCHALDKIKLGPPLRGIYGRRSGKDPQFTYSDAMKNSSAVWDEPTLDRWLIDTESVIPGNDMGFRLNESADRSDIIAYLRQLSGR